jgi:tetratricopeptide (TPR) repeat protein
MTDALVALAKLENKYKKDTSDAEFWFLYSKASFLAFKYSEAQVAIDRAISLNPRLGRYHFEKGRLLNELDQLDRSLASLSKAISLQPAGEYYYWRGILNQRLNNTTAAKSDYESALALNFETAELHNNYAIALIGDKNSELALRQINRAIMMDRKYAQAYSARSKIYLYLLRVDSACADLHIATDLGYSGYFLIPDSVCNGSVVQQMKFAGDVCTDGKLYSQGIMAYSRIVEKGGLHPDYFLNRGYCYFKEKDYANAEKDYLKALQLPGASLDLLYNNLSLLFFDQQDYNQSMIWSAKRLELNPNNPTALLDRGLCCRKLKKYKNAESDFNRALEIDPTFFRAFGYRAFLFMELGQLQKAFDDANRAIELNAQYGYAYMVRAQVKQQLGMKDFCLDFYYAKKYGEPEADEGISAYCK